MRFELTVLGCNSALPTAQRFQTAQILNVSERFFLIDCGEGTQIQLRRFKQSLQKIDHIFISHIHGDHILGLPGLLSSLALLGRTKTLNIYGHHKLKEYIDFHINLFGGYLEYPINFHINEPIEQTLLFEDKMVSVYSFPLDHGKTPTSGFLFKEKQRPPNLDKLQLEKYKIPIKEMKKIRDGGDFTTKNGEIIKHETLTHKSPKPRSYAFCSDTRYNETIIPIINGVDLLYHEATFSDKEKELAKSKFHSTARQAGLIAKKANVRKLLIGHYSARYSDVTELENQAKNIFPNTIAVEDGFSISLPLEKRK